MMPNTAITAPTLAKVRRDIALAREHLSHRHHAFGGSARDSMEFYEVVNPLTAALEALAYAVERLAEMPQCDGSHADA